MRTIAIYLRDEQGLVTYHGEEKWDSHDELLNYYGVEDEAPVVVELSGWPHRRCRWHGKIGVGDLPDVAK